MSEPRTCGECRHWVKRVYGPQGLGDCEVPLPMWAEEEVPGYLTATWDSYKADVCFCFAAKEGGKS
jgi:hypothetical protein